MKIYRILSILLLLSLALNGCSSTKIKDECLVGRWMVTDDEALARAMIPPEAMPGMEDMRFRGVKGAAGLYFSADGLMTFRTMTWQVNFDVLVERILTQLILASDGAALAWVTVEDGQITVKEVDQEATSFTAFLDDEEMMNTNTAGDFAPFFVSGTQTAQYQCSGDDLSLTFADGGRGTFTLKLVRINEATPTP